MTTADIGAPLTRAELDTFLATDAVARLACLDTNGWAYNVPVWFDWDGERFWVIAAREAAWAHFLQAEPRVALCIDDPPTLIRVLCQGTARLIEPLNADGQWVAIANRMAVRYLGAANLDAYIAASTGLERWLFAIDIARLVSWRGPGRSEGSRLYL